MHYHYIIHSLWIQVRAEAREAVVRKYKQCRAYLKTLNESDQSISPVHTAFCTVYTCISTDESFYIWNTVLRKARLKRGISNVMYERYNCYYIVNVEQYKGAFKVEWHESSKYTTSWVNNLSRTNITCTRKCLISCDSSLRIITDH